MFRKEWSQGSFDRAFAEGKVAKVARRLDVKIILCRGAQNHQWPACVHFRILHFVQALEEEKDGEEELAEFIPIDSADMTGEEEEEFEESDAEPLSPVISTISPKKTTQKKTSITPVLSKMNIAFHFRGIFRKPSGFLTYLPCNLFKTI